MNRTKNIKRTKTKVFHKNEKQIFHIVFISRKFLTKLDFNHKNVNKKKLILNMKMTLYGFQRKICVFIMSAFTNNFIKIIS